MLAQFLRVKHKELAAAAGLLRVAGGTRDDRLMKRFLCLLLSLTLTLGCANSPPAQDRALAPCVRAAAAASDSIPFVSSSNSSSSGSHDAGALLFLVVVVLVVFAIKAANYEADKAECEKALIEQKDAATAAAADSPTDSVPQISDPEHNPEPSR